MKQQNIQRLNSLKELHKLIPGFVDVVAESATAKLVDTPVQEKTYRCLAVGIQEATEIFNDYLKFAKIVHGNIKWMIIPPNGIRFTTDSDVVAMSINDLEEDIIQYFKKRCGIYIKVFIQVSRDF